MGELISIETMKKVGELLICIRLVLLDKQWMNVPTNVANVTEAHMLFLSQKQLLFVIS
jgi:hypothetical protein